MALGAALLMVLLFGSTETKATLVLALLMLLIAIVQRLALTPEMVVLGRIIDWVPQEQPSSERSTFWLMHNAYVGLEMLNLALGLLMAGKLLFRSRRKRSVDVDQELMERRSAAR
jgi:TctA family transporter